MYQASRELSQLVRKISVYWILLLTPSMENTLYLQILKTASNGTLPIHVWMQYIHNSSQHASIIVSLIRACFCIDRTSSSSTPLFDNQTGAFVSTGCSRHAHARPLCTLCTLCNLQCALCNVHTVYCADTFEISNHFRQSFSPCLSIGSSLPACI